MLALIRGISAREDYPGHQAISELIIQFLCTYKTKQGHQVEQVISAMSQAGEDTNVTVIIKHGDRYDVSPTGLRYRLHNMFRSFLRKEYRKHQVVKIPITEQNDDYTSYLQHQQAIYEKEINMDAEEKITAIDALAATDYRVNIWKQVKLQARTLPEALEALGCSRATFFLLSQEIITHISSRGKVLITSCADTPEHNPAYLSWLRTHDYRVFVWDQWQQKLMSAEQAAKALDCSVPSLKKLSQQVAAHLGNPQAYKITRVPGKSKFPCTC